MSSKTLYKPTGRELEVVINLLQQHGAVVLPSAWDLDGVVMAIRDLAPAEIIVSGRKQSYLGDNIGLAHSIVHMTVNLEADNVVVEEIQDAQPGNGIRVNRESYISSVVVPVAHAELFDVVTSINMGHVRYASVERGLNWTKIEFNCSEHDKRMFIDAMDRFLRNAERRQKAIDAYNAEGDAYFDAQTTRPDLR